MHWNVKDALRMQIFVAFNAKIAVIFALQCWNLQVILLKCDVSLFSGLKFAMVYVAKSEHRGCPHKYDVVMR